MKEGEYFNKKHTGVGIEKATGLGESNARDNQSIAINLHKNILESIYNLDRS